VYHALFTHYNLREFTVNSEINYLLNEEGIGLELFVTGFIIIYVCTRFCR